MPGYSKLADSFGSCLSGGLLHHCHFITPISLAQGFWLQNLTSSAKVPVWKKSSCNGTHSSCQGWGLITWLGGMTQSMSLAVCHTLENCNQTQHALTLTHIDTKTHTHMCSHMHRGTHTHHRVDVCQDTCLCCIFMYCVSLIVCACLSSSLRTWVQLCVWSELSWHISQGIVSCHCMLHLRGISVNKYGMMCYCLSFVLRYDCRCVCVCTHNCHDTYHRIKGHMVVCCV